MRRFFAPEVVQTSTLDCGPAALKSLLDGFGIHTSYGRLREACQTGLDGTSIDTMELVANSLGLEAEQLLLPVDHVFLTASNVLPAIVVVTLPDGLSHFVVIWRRHGRWLQIMDPAVGRRWLRVEQFANDLYRHRMPVPASAWRDFAGSDDFLRALSSRLAHACLNPRSAQESIDRATSDPHWKSLAALDAACRALSAIQAARPIRNATRAAEILQALCDHPESIPAQYWSVRPVEDSDESEEQLWMRGAVLVRALKRRAESIPSEALPHELSTATTEAPPSALRQALGHVRGFGWFTPLHICLAIASVAAGMLLETLLFRGLFDFARELQIPGQRIGAVAALALFSLIVFLLELLTFTGAARLSRWFETSFRIAFLRKIPLLPDRYFQSRLQSDMGERSHSSHRLRHLPDICRSLLFSIAQLVATAAGMVWLEPAAASFVLLAVAAALFPAVAGRAFLNEADLRVRTHAGGLTRFYLDAALGLACIRAHGAEDNLRRAHASLLDKWMTAALRFQRAVARLDSLQITAMFTAIAMMFLLHPLQGSNIGRLLLFAYWALNLPTIGQTIGVLTRQIPSYRSLILRLAEPLASEEELVAPHLLPLPRPPAIQFEGVTTEASGHLILDAIDLQIPAGSHVAIVGASGAGKSSLVGALLGWLPLKNGRILIDGEPLAPSQIRRSAAWLDPAIQIWNQSLFANLTFGSHAGAKEAGEAVDAAHLRAVLQDLPDGLQTVLGEGGGRLSGGEGQRVRLGRAILRKDAPLVLLDEPFRGLDRELREQLLSETRHRWKNSTLLCITHDLAETRAFDRVVVVEGGRIVEQGTPAALLAAPGSHYTRLIRAEEQLAAGLWHPRHWRHIKIQSGRLVEDLPPRPSREAPKREAHEMEVAS